MGLFLCIALAFDGLHTPLGFGLRDNLPLLFVSFDFGVLVHFFYFPVSSVGVFFTVGVHVVIISLAPSPIL